MTVVYLQGVGGQIPPGARQGGSALNFGGAPPSLLLRTGETLCSFQPKTGSSNVWPLGSLAFRTPLWGVRSCGGSPPRGVTPRNIAAYWKSGEAFSGSCWASNVFYWPVFEFRMACRSLGLPLPVFGGKQEVPFQNQNQNQKCLSKASAVHSKAHRGQ